MVCGWRQRGFQEGASALRPNCAGVGGLSAGDTALARFTVCLEWVQMRHTLTFKRCPSLPRHQDIDRESLDEHLRGGINSETSARLGFPAIHGLERGVRPEFRDVASRHRVRRDIQ